MPDTELMWNVVKELGSVGLIVIAIVYVAVTYIKSRKPAETDCDSCDKANCSETLMPYLADMIKTNAELVVIMREQQQEYRRTSEKQQEVLQGLTLALNTQIAICKETLDRVKELS